MALPAGRYGVTKNQLLKIKKLPMNTIKLIEELTEKFNLLGSAAFKNSTSVVTESSYLVESGAVKDIVGWGNANLFDINTALNGYIDAEGNFVSYTSFKASDYLPIKAGEAYTLSYNRFTTEFGTGMRIAWYQADKTFIRRDGITETSALGKKSTSAVAPENAVYARISNPYWGNVGNNSADIQFEVGSTATAYEPYHASVEESKCDNSVIAPIENGTTASQAYAVGSHAIRNGAFITWKNAKAQGETINDASDYTSGDVANSLIKEATFGGTTSSIGALIVSTSNTRHVLSAEVMGCTVSLYKRGEGYGAVINTPQGEPIAETAVSGKYYYVEY